MSLSVSVPVSRARSAAALGLFGVLALAGCASDSSFNKYVPNIVTPYRMDIQQGNFVTQDMVEKLRPGLTRDQVRFILGTPLITDEFHQNRWDYPFRSAKGWNDPERAHMVVYFDSDGKDKDQPAPKLVCWKATVPPPRSEQQVPDSKGWFNWTRSDRRGPSGNGVLLSSEGKPDAGSDPCAAAVIAAPAGMSPQQAVQAGLVGSSTASSAATPAAGSAAVASAAPATPPAGNPAAKLAAQAATDTAAAQPLSAGQAQPEKKPEAQQPGVLRRMFGWLPGVSTEEANASAARAASPDNTPLPRPTIATPPRPEPPAETPPPVPSSASGAVSPPNDPAIKLPDPAAPVPTAAPAAANRGATLAANSATTNAATTQAQPITPAPGQVQPAPVAPPVTTPAPVIAAAPAVAPVATRPAPPATASAVLAAIERWRAAWQAKDANAYFATYAADFRPPAGLARPTWEAQRRDRLVRPTFINVKVSDPQVTVGGDDVAIVTFVQQYESNLLKETSTKIMKLARSGNDWRITEELTK